MEFTIYWATEPDETTKNDAFSCIKEDVEWCNKTTVRCLDDYEVEEFDWDGDEQELIDNHPDASFYEVLHDVGLWEQPINLIAVEY